MNFHCSESSSATPTGYSPNCSLQPRLQPATLIFLMSQRTPFLGGPEKPLWPHYMLRSTPVVSPSIRCWHPDSVVATWKYTREVGGETAVGCPFGAAQSKCAIQCAFPDFRLPPRPTDLSLGRSSPFEPYGGGAGRGRGSGCASALVDCSVCLPQG